MSGLLIDTLKESLDPALAAQLNTSSHLREVADSYLQDLLINEQLLSTETFTTTSQEDATGTHQKTLTEEIAELDLQLRQIDLQLAAITNSNRDLIVDVSRDLKTATNKIEVRLEKEISGMMHSLKDSHIRIDSKSAERHTASITLNNSVLSNIDSILDILELPTLCRLCIMQGNYQEALEISTLVKMLIIKFPKLAIFHKIQSQIEKELQLMVRGLIKLLNTNLKQSNILKIFQILNRPDLVQSSTSALSSASADPKSQARLREKSLKIIYLNSRFKFITDEAATLKPLLKLKKMTYLKRYIEVFREYLFNSLSIYQAIFMNSSLNSSTDEDKLLINTYIRNLVNLIVAELRLHLPASSKGLSDDDVDDASRRDGVILQIIYLCKSLDKYGVNFESAITWELCMKEPALISEEEWTRNLTKVKKFRT
ncbi:CIC11C00000003451 [Sungouiella intermedia]|uniref:Conserved oligomeric Golgi complex subunit 8 n=1 Tax=Sungouiella intermedia TaxID=45354 RepID=A0A1L0DA83_9ASCO|nr:CIC11C00000003451 [[Candida] intermedia]SGZ53028.1 CIC11C00000001133 [[Candida] intermedia]